MYHYLGHTAFVLFRPLSQASYPRNFDKHLLRLFYHCLVQAFLINAKFARIRPGGRRDNQLGTGKEYVPMVD